MGQLGRWLLPDEAAIRADNEGIGERNDRAAATVVDAPHDPYVARIFVVPK